MLLHKQNSHSKALVANQYKKEEKEEAKRAMTFFRTASMNLSSIDKLAYEMLAQLVACTLKYMLDKVEVISFMEFILDTVEQRFENFHRDINPENFLVGDGRKANMRSGKKRCKG